MEPSSSDDGLADERTDAFSLILIPVDVLKKLHKDFSAIVGAHLADHVFYQTGYLCGEVSSGQYRDFNFEGSERIDIMTEMINQCGFGLANISEEGKDDMEIVLTDAGDNAPAIRPPGLIFASGFIAGFATALAQVRYRCIWDTPTNDDATDEFKLYLAGVPKAGALFGQPIEDALKEDG
jgi:hypothetical protein